MNDRSVNLSRIKIRNRNKNWLESGLKKHDLESTKESELEFLHRVDSTNTPIDQLVACAALFRLERATQPEATPSVNVARLCGGRQTVDKINS